MVSKTSQTDNGTHGPPGPVIIEVGRRSKDQINKLRQGRGRIRRDIDGVLGKLREAGDMSEDAQVVIVVVRQQQRSNDEDNCSWWWW